MADIQPTANTAIVKIEGGAITETNPPTVTNSGDKQDSGSPTITKLSAGVIANTGIQKSNNTRSHSCDIPIYVKKAINLAGMVGGQIIKAIRTAVKALLKALGITPGSNAISQKLKTLAQDLKDLRKYIDDATKWVNGLIVYVNKIKEIIAYILSLPAQAAAFFADCLKKAYAELKQGYLDAVAGSTGGDTDFTESINAAKAVMQETANLIKSTAQLAASPINLLAAASNPTLPPANTEQQIAATNAVYAAAGYPQKDPNQFKNP